jgi:hypothetical protein
MRLDPTTFSLATLSITTVNILGLNAMHHKDIQHKNRVFLCWEPNLLLLFWVSLCWVSLNRMSLRLNARIQLLSPSLILQSIFRCFTNSATAAALKMYLFWGSMSLVIKQNIKTLPYFIEYNAHTSIVRTWISQWFLAKKYFYFSRIISKEVIIASLFIIKAILNPFSATLNV